MAKKVTNKRTSFGNNRSHALNATRRPWKLNLQKVKLEDGSTVVMTARELKTLRKNENKIN